MILRSKVNVMLVINNSLLRKRLLFKKTKKQQLIKPPKILTVELDIKVQWAPNFYSAQNLI